MGLPINKKVQLEGTYDFDVDGGATGTFNLISVPANFRVEELWYEVETAATSGGTPTVEFGDGTDPNGYLTDIEATMGVTGIKASNQDDKGVLLWDTTEDAGLQHLYTSADTIDLILGTAALTAGKIKLSIRGTRLP